MPPHRQARHVCGPDRCGTGLRTDRKLGLAQADERLNGGTSDGGTSDGGRHLVGSVQDRQSAFARIWVTSFVYGKATQTAIAALSRLAEVYDGGATRLSAVELAESRGLQRAFVGKVLSTLSQAGLIVGTRGPGGGFQFAKHPSQVTLYDVFCLFEREDHSNQCPFGGGICGAGDKCPLHDRLAEVKQATERMLHQTNFDAFRIAYQKGHSGKQWRLSDREQGETTVARETYRAPIG